MSALLVSDSEREYTVGLLRQHLVSGRLTPDEFEQRVDEAWRARFASDLWQALRWLPAPAEPARIAPSPSDRFGTAVTAAVLSVLGLVILCFTFGFGWPLALPLSATGWALGRSARREGGRRARGPARAGEVLGIVGTGLAVLFLAGCAAVLASLS